MHVAMIIDSERLRQEHTMLNRLSIGLIDQGVQLTRIVPDSIELEAIWRSEQRIALASRIEVPMRVMPWMKRLRAARIAEQFNRSTPDVFYAVGQQAWPVALQTARLLERPVALGIWRAALIRKASRQHSNKHVAAFIAPTKPIADALKERVDPELVGLVPLGVAIPRNPRPILAGNRESIGIAIIGSGKDVPAYDALLGAISRIVREFPHVQIALELRGPRQHDIWQIARRLELLGSISPIEDAAQHRTLLTCCDMMLVPESFGELSSVMLDAMAAGMPVIARKDPYLDMLVHDQTAVLVQETSPQAWVSSITALLRDPDRASWIGLAGREYVREHHPSRVQIMRLTAMLEQVVSGSAYAFPRGKS